LLFWKFQTLNELLHIPRIIPVKFHYNLIKKISFEHSREWRSFWKFSYRNVDIFKMVCCHGNHESLKKKKIDPIMMKLHRNDSWDVQMHIPVWKFSKWSPFPWMFKRYFFYQIVMKLHRHFCDRPKKKKFPEEKKIPHRIDSIVNPPTI
jgi:hypothetical protein